MKNKLKMETKITDAFLFLRAWLSNPLQVAAIIPSNKALAELVTRGISNDTGKVIELGPGTGIFTRALLSRGVVEKDLMLFEFGDKFANLLRTRFPDARVLNICATCLNNMNYYKGEEKAGATVSGLPLVAISPEKVEAILKGTFEHMKDDGVLYQFTYRSRCPIPLATLQKLKLEAFRIGGTKKNIPPASVYRIQRLTQGSA